MQTIEAKFTEDTTLLTSGIKEKIDTNGTLKDAKTKISLQKLSTTFEKKHNNEK